MKTTKCTSVPWWTEELTVMRRRINAPRRYQRTANNDDLRESRKNQYHYERKKYQATIKREKLNPGKNSVNLPRPQIHAMQSTNLPRTKQKEARHCHLYRNKTNH
jgi:hypothetical protein